jgi:hypothetical protein
MQQSFDDARQVAHDTLMSNSHRNKFQWSENGGCTQTLLDTSLRTGVLGVPL